MPPSTLISLPSSKGRWDFYRLFNVAVIMNSIEMYSLIGRCLKGHPSPEDVQHLKHLLQTDPLFLREYDFFKSLLHDDNKSEPSSPTDVSEKFDRITRRLRDEGLL